MSILPHLAAAGVWPALPLTGYCLGRLSRVGLDTSRFPAATSFSLASAAGIAVWSVPLLILAEAGAYSGALLGLIGWAVALPAAAVLLRDRRARGWPGVHLSPWDVLLGIVACAVAALYLGWPTEALTHHDEGIYARQAIYLANHGDLHPALPWPPDSAALFRAVDRPPGMFRTGDTYELYFGHLYQTWLAHAYATLGPAGLFRLNALFGLLAAGLFYGLCRSVVARPAAVAATLVLALNVSQVWLARGTLSEMMTQLFVTAGLLLLGWALRSGSAADAAWAGVFLGLTAAVRIDGFLLAPLALGAHLAHRIVEHPERRCSRVWLAFYATALPVFSLDVWYYSVFAREYFVRHLPLVRSIGLATLVAACLLLLGLTRASDLVRTLVRARLTTAAVGIALLVAATYAYFIRPITTTAYFGSETYRANERSYAEDSLVNLGIYLSPLVIWVGLLGWFVALGLAIRRRERTYLLPALVVVFGYSALYIYDPVITPLHYWAVRRFLPVAIPGFVLFAAVGGAWLAARVRSPRWRAGIAAACAAFLLGWTIRGDALIYRFAEQRGHYAQLQALAEKLPEDEVVLALHRGDEFRHWAAALNLAFDRRIVPVNVGDRSAAVRLVRAWTRKRSAITGRPVVVVTGPEVPPALLQPEGISARATDTVVLSYLYSEWTTQPLPKRIVEDRPVVRFYSLRPAPLDEAGTSDARPTPAPRRPPRRSVPRRHTRAGRGVRSYQVCEMVARMRRGRGEASAAPILGDGRHTVRGCFAPAPATISATIRPRLSSRA